MNNQEEKHQLRLWYQNRRKALSEDRRKEASQKACASLKKITDHYALVLSFSPKKEELDIWHLNDYLAAENQLVLPKVEGVHLALYQVEDPHTQLKLGAFQVLEPDETMCKRIELNEISLFLIPGIVFDREGNRIGFGGGYYDRLIASVYTVMKVGVGFCEQQHPFRLPIEEQDRPVNQLCLC